MRKLSVSLGVAMLFAAVGSADAQSMRSAAQSVQQGFGALPVLDKGEHLVGILSKGDLIRALHNKLLNELEHGRH